MKKFLLALIFGSLSLVNINATDFIAVGKDGKVYDEANAKYVTLNQNNDDVNVVSGMVFATTEHTPGWYKVEYSPGLHAFIPEQIVTGDLRQIQPGTFEIKNNPAQKLNVQGSGENWSANIDGKNYKGTLYGDILVFVDENNKVAYSLVDLGNGPIAITYDNSITNFF